MKKIWFVGLAALVLVPSIALAAEFRASESGSATIDQGEQLKNAYLAGQSVTANGNVSEDLLAAGNFVTITGTVENDLFAAGNTLNLNGPVGKSARVAGGTVNVNNTVGSDLMVAGGTIDITNAVTVGDDLAAAGGTVTLNGNVNGKAYLTGGQITINGAVNGDVVIKSSQKVTIGDNAVIGGKLNYQSEQEATIAPGAQIAGAVNYDKVTRNNNAEKKFKAVFGTFALLQLLALFVLLTLLVYLLPKTIRQFVEGSFEKPLENLGIGLLYAIVVPIAAIMLLVTVLGMDIALLAGGLYLITVGLAKAFVPLLIGAFLMKQFGKEKVYRLDWLTILIGVIVAALITMIPILGWFVMFVLFLIAIAQAPRAFQYLIKAQQ